KGPDADRLRRLARDHAMTDHVVFTGGVDYAELPAYFAAGTVFAMPCRTRRLGMDVEGLGIVFLEASATGLPVIAGDSGGAPDAVQDGVTGVVIDGRVTEQVVAAVSELLNDSRLSTAMGTAGRGWVEQSWQWDSIAERLAEMLGLD